MTEPSHEIRSGDSAPGGFELAGEAYLEARELLIAELLQLSLADFVRLLRNAEDPISQLAGSAGVYGRIAAVHFPGDQPGGAMNMLLEMGLRFVSNEDLDSEAPRAKDWIYRDFDFAFGLISPDNINESPQL